MKGLLKKTSFYKFMPVLACLFLAACGSGGGGDGFIDLGGPPGTGVCNQSESKVINNDGGSLESKDGKATIVIARDAIPLTGSAQVLITVRCGMSSFNGLAYEVRFPAGTPPTYSLLIKFEGSVPPGVILKLGTLTGALNPPWAVVPNAIIANNIAQADGLNTPDDIYGIFVQSSGGGGSAPTAPTNVRAVAAIGACRIDITWSPSTDPDGDLTSYTVFRDGGVNLGAERADTCFGTCSSQDIDNPTGNFRLLRNTSHTYFIRATDVKENRADSNDSNRVTAPSVCPLS